MPVPYHIRQMWFYGLPNRQATSQPPRSTARRSRDQIVVQDALCVYLIFVAVKIAQSNLTACQLLIFTAAQDFFSPSLTAWPQCRLGEDQFTERLTCGPDMFCGVRSSREAS